MCFWQPRCFPVASGGPRKTVIAVETIMKETAEIITVSIGIIAVNAGNTRKIMKTGVAIANQAKESTL